VASLTGGGTTVDVDKGRSTMEGGPDTDMRADAGARRTVQSPYASHRLAPTLRRTGIASRLARPPVCVSSSTPTTHGRGDATPSDSGTSVTLSAEGAAGSDALDLELEELLRQVESTNLKHSDDAASGVDGDDTSTRSSRCQLKRISPASQVRARPCSFRGLPAPPRTQTVPRGYR
jgi:hypothetical protein